MPTDLQQILQSASARLNAWMLAEFEAKNTIYLKKLTAEANVDIRYYPADVLQQLRIYTEEILEELTAKDAFSKKVYASYQKFRLDCAKWSELTEKAYYEQLLDL